MEGESVFTRAGAVPNAGVAFDPPALRAAVRRLVAAAGGSVFVSKRITHNRRIAELHATFPRARYLHVIRDGRQVARSLVRVDWWPRERLWWLDGRPVAEVLASGDAEPYELAARHWLAEVDAVEQGLTGIDPALVTTARYEDLVEGGRPALEALLRFAPLAPTDGWRSAVDAVQAQRRPGPPDTAALPRVVERLQEAELARLGYLV